MRSVRLTVCCALLVQIAICPRLWISDRDFPTVPMIEGLPALPLFLELILLGLLAIGAMRVSRGFSPALALVAGSLLVLFDINRLQPWFYLLLLLLGAVGRGRPAIAIVLAATYVWSGLLKFNPGFQNGVFPWLLEPFGLGETMKPFWFLVPILETAIGIGLLFSLTRKVAVIGSVAMHIFLLVALGGLGRNFNPVVWPWNVWMPLLVVLVFWREEGSVFPAVAKCWVGRAVLLLVGILPSLNLVGLWDDYLSFALYSGKSRQAFLILTPEAAKALPDQYQRYLQKRPDRIGLDISRWGLRAMSVPPYPAVRVYRSIARKLIEEGVPVDGIRLLVTKPYASGRVEEVDVR